MNSFTTIPKFRFWCQKILPLVYDDSLSYMELLCKVVDYLNKVIEDINNIPDYINSMVSDEKLKEILSELLDELREQIARANEGENTTASFNRDVDELVWLNGKLVRMTRAILAGDRYVEDDDTPDVTGNFVYTSVELELQRVKDNLADEINDREQADTRLQANIDAEALARQQADAGLQDNIDDEVLARQQADTQLQTNIDNEVLARQQADTQLQTNIDTLDNILTNQDIANVKDYGATGNGVTDDTQAFLNAINSNKSIVYVPNGNYVITASLSLHSNIKILGSGTILDKRASVSDNFEGLLSIDECDNVLISGLRFKGNGAVTSPNFDGAFVSAHNSTKIHYHRLYCSDVHENYALILRNCSNSLIDYCSVVESSYCAIANLDEGNYVTIDHCYVKNVIGTIGGNSYGIVIHSGNVRPITAHHLWCTNNYVEGVTGWEGIDAHGGDYITCTRNTVLKCRAGICIFRDDARTITCKYANVSNNTVIGFDTMPNITQYTGIIVGADYSTYRNNYISKYGCDGDFSALQQNTAMDVRLCVGSVIEDNYFYDNTGVCLHFRQNVFDLTIKGNVFDKLNPSSVADSNYYKYIFYFMSGNYGRIVIENNDFRDYDCISLNPNFNSGTSINYLRYKNNSYKNGIVFVRPNNCVCEYVTSPLAISQGEIGDICYYATSSNNIIYYMCVQSSTKTPVGGDNAVWRAVTLPTT